MTKATNRNIEIKVGPDIDGVFYWEPAKRANHIRSTMGELPEGYLPVRLSDGSCLLMPKERIRAA